MSAKSTYYRDKYFKGRHFHTINPKLAILNQVEPLLNEYFGLNYGHFWEEIDRTGAFLPDAPFYLKSYEEQVEELKGLADLELEISHIATSQELTKLLKGLDIENSNDQEIPILLTLFWLSYIVVVRQIHL